MTSGTSTKVKTQRRLFFGALSVPVDSFMYKEFQYQYKLYFHNFIFQKERKKRRNIDRIK